LSGETELASDRSLKVTMWRAPEHFLRTSCSEAGTEMVARK
jgi:hypothetical protein